MQLARISKRQTAADCGDPYEQGKYYKCMAKTNKDVMRLPKCDPGTQTKCVPCDEGMYKAGKGSLACLTCPDGYVSEPDFTKCKAAGSNRLDADDDVSEDMDNLFLAAGQTAVAERKRRHFDATEYDFTDSYQQKQYYETYTETLEALKCGKGKTAICEPCPEGTFKALGNPMPCIDCPGPSPEGARFCDADCPPGTWWSVGKKGKKANCKKCKKKTYKADSGPEPCEKCPDNYVPVQPTDTEYGPTQCEKDWCATSPCGPDSKGCDNVDNGYRCHCKDGTTNSDVCLYLDIMQNDSENNSEKDWCATSPCGPDSKGCDNVDNGYRCHCKDGTTNSDVCLYLDIMQNDSENNSEKDWCATSPCGPYSKGCDNVDNGYRCHCKDGTTNSAVCLYLDIMQNDSENNTDPIDTCVQELEDLINSSINSKSVGIPSTTLTDALCNIGTTNWERIVELAGQCTTTIMYNDMETSTSEYTQNFMCDDSGLHDCRDVYESGHNVTGVYSVNVNVSGQLQRQQVYCDMDTPPGGWTVFQKRFDGSVDFYRYFNEYESGFGDLHGEFWLGLKWVYWMTLSWPSVLFINLTEASTGNEKSTRYGSFFLGSPSGYNLHVSSWSGTAGEGLNYQNGMPFSTRDHDADGHPVDCAEYKHAGYWFMHCSYSNLNGNFGGVYNTTLPNSGFVWKAGVQLSHSQMAFRRT